MIRPSSRGLDFQDLAGGQCATPWIRTGEQPFCAMLRGINPDDSFRLSRLELEYVQEESQVHPDRRSSALLCVPGGLGPGFHHGRCGGALQPGGLGSADCGGRKPDPERPGGTLPSDLLRTDWLCCECRQSRPASHCFAPGSLIWPRRNNQFYESWFYVSSRFEGKNAAEGPGDLPAPSACSLFLSVQPFAGLRRSASSGMS